MSADLDVYFDTVLNITKNAGKLIRDLNSVSKKVETKSCDVDLVTETDQQIEKMFIDGLTSKFPGHKFIGEETASACGSCTLTNDPTWIIDPIDGTMNFVHGFPHSSISVALFINCEPYIAIVYNPVLEQMFTARKGKGAFYNGKRMKVSDETNLSRALVCIEAGTSRDPDKLKIVIENLHTLTSHIQGTRSLGSAALNMAMVAYGAADAYYEFGIHIWDMAAGELLIKEAGGVIIDPTGDPFDRLSRRILCAGTQELADQISKKLIQYYPLPRD